jgi:hypothetical protein
MLNPSSDAGQWQNIGKFEKKKSRIKAHIFPFFMGEFN